MYSNFERLSEEKKKKIIEAAVGEFANKGYVNASTNSIVKVAGISKGALFNYFGNKKNLYLYVVDNSVTYYLNLMINKMEANNPDIFQRILEWQELKISISTEQPIAYKFFASVFMNPPEEVKEEIAQRYERLYELGHRLTIEDVDLSKFREDIDRRKALEVILMSLSGFLGNSILVNKSLRDYGYGTREQSYEALKGYVEVLRKAFYKEGL